MAEKALAAVIQEAYIQGVSTRSVDDLEHHSRAHGKSRNPDRSSPRRLIGPDLPGQLISDDHKGLKAAATRILGATWQRCRVHFARNLLAHAGARAGASCRP